MPRLTPPSPRTAPRGRPRHLLAGVVSSVLVLGACGSGGSGEPTEVPEPAVSPSGSAASAPPSPDDEGTPPAPTIRGAEVASSIGGFRRPWDLRFLPDGTPLVTERGGMLVAVVDGQRQEVAAVPNVVAQGEGGLMGLALDPDFAENRRLYTCYAAGSDGRATDVRVVRFRLAEDLSGLSDPTPLVTGIPAGAGNRHLGCRLEIGPDGMLWITTGDAVQPTAPQDPTSRAGKVLRATLAGRPAPDNPGGGWDRYVYTLGHRNPQGLSFRPSDGLPVAAEHGTGCDDEINALRPGGNYGWDPVGSGGGYAEAAPMTSPDVPGAVPALWSSGCPTIAPSGAEFITDGQWGQWAGQLAVAVLKDQQLLLVALDGQRVTDTSVQLDGELGRLRTVRNAPDGSLWLTVDADPGQLVRVVPRT